MLPSNDVPKILFFINPASGSNDTDWETLIQKAYHEREIKVILQHLPKDCNPAMIKQQIQAIQPSRVVAVGGDGTVKLVAEALMHGQIPLGILPAGSANGMAKEFNIPNDPSQALDIIETGETRQIHLLSINNEICIHLADIGFNAKVVKRFEEDNTRGMWGYLKSAWKVIWQHSRMQVKIKTDEGFLNRSAVMVVMANGTKYGNGVVINPLGSLYDRVFELVIVRKISFIEIFKMRFIHNRLDVKKTELLQTAQVELKSRRSMHFQVDGEYLGKVKLLQASVIPNAIWMIVPR